MSETKPNLVRPPFSMCGRGHDLTMPDAYIYRDSGFRDCKECAAPQMQRSGRRKEKLGSTWFKG